MLNFLGSPGVPGIIVGILIFLGCLAVATLVIKPLKNGAGYPIDPNGPRSFEPGLTRYTRLVEIQIGLATGSIVLLAGSSFLHPAKNVNPRHLPNSYGSPLVLLAMSVVLSLLFISIFSYSYEETLHDANFYKPNWFRVVTALGFSGLLSFAVGYVWLAFALVSTDLIGLSHR